MDRKEKHGTTMKHILMADGSDHNLKCAREILGSSYEMIPAQSGKETLLLLKKVIPDLILLDVALADMSGYDVMERIKEDDQLKEVPVIFLTAEADREGEIRGLKMGAMDFIRKPFDAEIMRSRIEKILKMTDQKKELQDIALKDGLTDLLNRRSMERLLNQTDAAREEGFFMLLDLDNFKEVNDKFGHVVGDKVLIRFARILEELVGDDSSLCRLGGDEFAIYFRGSYEKDEITNIVQRMIREIEFEINELVLDSEEVSISISAGVSQKPEDGTGFAELYAAADKALYFVKQNGKGNCHFYRDTANELIDVENEPKQVDLGQLQKMIQEEEYQRGVYKVGYNRFKWMYGFVSQYREKKSQDAHIILLTVQDEEDGELEKDRAEEGIELLEKAISQSLRWGDIATKCGNGQYIVLLLNASYENGTMVAERIRSKYKELSAGRKLILNYEVGNVGKSGE